MSLGFVSQVLQNILLPLMYFLQEKHFLCSFMDILALYLLVDCRLHSILCFQNSTESCRLVIVSRLSMLLFCKSF